MVMTYDVKRNINYFVEKSIDKKIKGCYYIGSVKGATSEGNQLPDANIIFSNWNELKVKLLKVNYRKRFKK